MCGSRSILLEDAKVVITRALDKMSGEQLHEWNKVKSKVRDVASSFFYEHTGRRPMIMPIVIDVPGNSNN
jgi:ribonuclease J